MKAEHIFHQALEQPSDRRVSFLDTACGEDTDLRECVEVLLRAHANPGSFLESPAHAIGISPTTAQPITEKPGTQVGPYKLLQEIGHGGMGVVYMAEQTNPVERRVALKVIKPGMDTRQVIARFEAERQALAMMDHPHIARVFDAGTTESGRPYFVMELVKGVPITQYCDEHRLTPKARLELFLPVLHAIQHAHQKGVIHRDIKPTNVLVAEYDDCPVPKVIDFGVAKATSQKLTEKTMFTGFGQIVGTLEYMSPEQARVNQLDIDTRSDIYSLGVLLYELLAGATPFDKQRLRSAAWDEMLRIIREEDPPKPSVRLSDSQDTLPSISSQRQTEPAKLTKLVCGELDWIVMKAIDKDRNRRYQTANGFADDVQCYLNDEPVYASPPSAVYRLQKFARRNRVALTAAAVVSLALVLGTGVSTWQAIRASQAESHAIGETQKAQEERRRAVTAAQSEQVARQAESLQRQRAEASETQANDRLQEVERQRLAVAQNLYFADMRLGLVDWDVGNIGRLSRKLFAHVPPAGEDDLRGWEWYYLLGLCHQDERTLMHHGGGYVTSVAWSPDGRYVASTGYEGAAMVYDAATGGLLQNWMIWTSRGASWSPDSRQLAWGTTSEDSGVYVGQVETGEIKKLAGHTDSVWTTAWSPDGRYLASGGMDHTIRIWDPASALCIRVMDIQNQFVSSLAWHPAGKVLASLEWDADTLTIWDTISGETLHTQGVAGGLVQTMSMGWSPDGTQLALGTTSGKCRLYDTADWSISAEWDAHRGPVNSVAWNADGNRLASAGADHLIRLSDPSNGSCVLTMRGHLNQVNSVAWDPGGNRLASGGFDGLVKVWPLPPAPQPRRLEGHPGGVRAIAWCEDRDTLRSIGAVDGTIGLWNVASGHRLADLAVPLFSSGAFNAGGKLLALSTAVENQPEVFILDARSGERIRNVTKASPAAMLSALSADGSRLALTHPFEVDTLEVLDVHQNEVCFRAQLIWPQQMFWSPNGRLLALAGHGDAGDGGGPAYAAWVHVFDIDKKQRVMKVQHGTSRVVATAVAWSPDGRRLVSGDVNGLVEIREVPSGIKVASEELHSAQINSLAWSPDGRRIASASMDGAVRISDAGSCEELLKLDTADAMVSQLEWSLDGRRLAASTPGGAISIWDTSPAYEFVKSESYYCELVHDQLRIAIELYEAGHSDEAFAQIEQAISANSSGFESIPQWVTRGIGRLASIAATAGRHEEAIKFYKLLIRLNADNAGSINHFAWSLATGVENELRYIPEAIEFARRAVKLNASSGAVWNTLGVALYRNGDWQAAIDALQMSMDLRHGGDSCDSFDWFFLAMAHWKLGNRDEARKWHDQALQWMDRNQPENEELRRFRAEAEELLNNKTGDTDQKRVDSRIPDS